MIKVLGTGSNGRITREDFETFLAGGGRVIVSQGKTKQTGTQEIKLIGLRHKIIPVKWFHQVGKCSSVASLFPTDGIHND